MPVTEFSFELITQDGKARLGKISTPSSKKRIENLNNWITEVILKYPPIKI